MKNFVISITNALDRRAHINSEFNGRKISFEFFDAVTPDNMKQIETKLGISLDKAHDLTENEKSCFLSHYSLWCKALDENHEFIAIFEDDIYLSNSAALFLNNNDWIDVDFLKIEKTKKNVLLKNKKKYKIQAHNFEIGILKNAHMGAGGYILSKKAALSLINFVNSQTVIDHVDQMIFDWYKKFGEYSIYQMNPVLCIQDCIRFPENQKFSTTLQWRNKEKKKLNLMSKFSREINRLMLNILEAPYKVTLYFK